MQDKWYLYDTIWYPNNSMNTQWYEGAVDWVRAAKNPDAALSR
jgi:hypothetical protein